MPENDWRDDANCLTADPNMMQPERATVGDVAEAKAVCMGCPVKLDCRELAKSQQSLLSGTTAYGVHAGEWWGPAPVWLVERQCEHCGESFRTERDGNRSARFCKQACQKAAWRSREQSA